MEIEADQTFGTFGRLQTVRRFDRNRPWFESPQTVCRNDSKCPGF